MKYALIALITTSTLLAGCSVINQRTGEEALFSSLAVDGDYEIRLYEPVIIAQTAVSGKYSTATRTGYNRLTDYVSGNNRAKQTVSVNPPISVISGDKKQPKVELTLPYFEEYIDGTWLISVAMPESYRLETLPKPVDSSITFKVLPRLKTAVINFTGYKSEGLISRNSALLNQWIAKNALTPTSSARSVIYDSPWTVPLLRRHEIHINVE
jgi:hypothetical protein